MADFWILRLTCSIRLIRAACPIMSLGSKARSNSWKRAKEPNNLRELTADVSADERILPQVTCYLRNLPVAEVNFINEQVKGRYIIR